MKTLSIQEIEDMLPRAVKKQYRGFVMRDEKKPLLEVGYYVINLDSEDNPGTHWCLAIITPDDEPNLYFDSFGQPPPEEILKWLKTGGKDLMYSTSHLQDKNSASCGWFVINLMKYLTTNKKKSATDNLYNFVTRLYKDGDVSKNEALLERRFKRPTAT